LQITWGFWQNDILKWTLTGNANYWQKPWTNLQKVLLMLKDIN
jgi:hypothetical protein